MRINPGTCIEIVYPGWSRVEWGKGAGERDGAVSKTVEEGAGREMEAGHEGEEGEEGEEEVMELVVHVNDSGLVA